MTTANDKRNTPVVGEGATHCLWTDCKAYTVIKVSASGKTAWIQRDKAVLLNGAKSGEPDALKVYPGGFAAHVAGTQRYSYERDPEGHVLKVTRRDIKVRDDGSNYYASKEDVAAGNYKVKVIWKPVGGRTRSPGNRVTFGHRSEHYDYNF